MITKISVIIHYTYKKLIAKKLLESYEHLVFDALNCTLSDFSFYNNEVDGGVGMATLSSGMGLLCARF